MATRGYRGHRRSREALLGQAVSLALTAGELVKQTLVMTSSRQNLAHQTLVARQTLNSGPSDDDLLLYTRKFSETYTPC